MKTKLFCADYSAIEARVLFWLAGHTDGVKAFADSRPIYEEMAARIYRKEITKVTKAERELGKRVILGCGYNMGPKKFMETCQTFADLKVDEALAQMAVSVYRELHWPVPVLWKTVEHAALAAVSTGKRFETGNGQANGRTQWFCENKILYARLPSGRKLAYVYPEIQYKLTPWFEKRPALYHYSVNPISEKWELGGTYGGRLVENITQAVARDFLVEAMLRIENAGYRIVLTVHDEIVAENEKGSLEEFENLMSEIPAWGKGCPIKVAGWVGPRYL